MMREQRIFEELQAKLNEVPIQDRLGLSAEFSISRKTTAQNIELFYKLATQRLSTLAYYLEWAKTLEKNEIATPHPGGNYKTSEISISFHDIENIDPQERQAYNNSFSCWTINQIIRELNEFLLFYLLDIHETCIVVKYADKKILPEDIVNGRKGTELFEKMGMKDRLESLENFGLIIPHKAEICSLYDVRNVFSHFDGIVQKKFCKDNGKLKVSWPVNTYKLRHREKDKFFPYHRISKPFSSDEYDKVQIIWLNKPKVCLYAPMQRIQLTYSDIKDLIFFYLYVFDNLQGSLIQYVEKHNVKARPFEQYVLQSQMSGVTYEGVSMKLDLLSEESNP